MNRKTRRIILIGAVLFFVLATPATLLYAWGYSFDWQEKNFVLTGGLYLKSAPKKAEVYINDELQEQNTPIFIKRLLPKEYQIRVAKQGYHSWQKNLKVESRIVTEAKNILLIPLSPEIEIIDQKLPLNFSLDDFIKEESNSVFYINKPSYILYKTDQENSFQEQISLTPLPKNHEYRVFASPNEQIAVLDEKNQLYLLNSKTKTFGIINQDVQGLEFSNDNRRLLYYTPSEIWIHHLRESNQIADDKELVTRLSQKIKQAIWYKTNEHIIFSTPESVKMVELDNRGDRNIVSITKAQAREIAYSIRDDKIYFVQENQLMGVGLE